MNAEARGTEVHATPAASEAGRDPSHRRQRLVAAALAVSVSVIHLVGSWVPSFWYDEAATLQLARLSPTDFFRFVGERDAVHALYGFGMHVWIQVFGESELSLRAPSALAIGVATAGVYLLTRRFGASPLASLFGGLVFALLPRIVVQAVEARSYAVAVALLVAAAWCIAEWCETRRWRAWIGYLLLMSLAIWTFAYSMLALPAFAYLAYTSPTSRQRTWSAASALAPLVAASPLLPLMLRQKGQVSWLEEQSVSGWTVLVEPFYGWSVWMALLVLGLFVLAPWRILISQKAVHMLALWLFVPPIALLLASVLVQPVYTPRYLSMCAPALAILSGMAVHGKTPRWILTVAIAWVLSATPAYVWARQVDSKPGSIDFRDVALTVSRNAAAGDAVLFGTDGVGALRPRVALAAYPGSFESLTDIALRQPFPATGTYWDRVEAPSEVDLRSFARVWVVDRESSDFDRELRGAGYTPATIGDVTGIRIVRWDAPARRDVSGKG